MSAEHYYTIQDRVFIYKNALPLSLIDSCLKFIQNSFDNKDFFIRYHKDDSSVIYLHHNDATKEMMDTFYNSNDTKIQKVAQIPPTTDITFSLLPFYKNVLESIYKRDVINHTSDFFMYGPGHYMDKHADGSDNRVCTTVLYLNEMTENDIGGETLFYELNDESKVIYEYKPVKGDLIIFDSSLVDQTGLKHSVTKIQNWKRYAHRIYWK